MFYAYTARFDVNFKKIQIFLELNKAYKSLSDLDNVGAAEWQVFRVAYLGLV